MTTPNLPDDVREALAATLCPRHKITDNQHLRCVLHVD